MLGEREEEGREGGRKGEKLKREWRCMEYLINNRMTSHEISEIVILFVLLSSIPVNKLLCM